MLKELFDYITEPLALFMNETLLTGALPEESKLAHVTPILKNKGAKNLAVNYRPVSEFDFNRLQANGIDSKRAYYATSC